ncbi:MAG TPA: PDZ domain-containing protein, partial [Candidatus Methylomirabilis sp.]
MAVRYSPLPVPPAERARRAPRAAGAALWLFAWLAAGMAAAQVAVRAAGPVPDRPMGWLGITIQDVGEELAEQLATRFGVAAGTGVLVVETMPGGPAAAAGLRRGDVIVALDSQPIWDVRQLQRRIRAAPVGRPTVVAVLREQGRVQVPVAVGAMPDEAMAMVLGETLGFSVRATLPEGGRGAGRPPGKEHQVVVAAVDPRSPARAAGLLPMDVV